MIPKLYWICVKLKSTLKFQMSLSVQSVYEEFQTDTVRHKTLQSTFLANRKINWWFTFLIESIYLHLTTEKLQNK